MRNPSYYDAIKRGSAARFRVACAWVDGRSCAQGNYATDGRNLYSYGHIVGTTDADGLKVAHDCHYSVTTTKQTGPARTMADRVVACTDHCVDSSPVKRNVPLVSQSNL